MRAPTTHRTLAAVALMVPLVAATTVPGAAASPAAGATTHAWIVTLADGADADAVSADHGRRHGAQVERVYRHALRGYAARMSDQAVERVRTDARVASVEADGTASIAAPKPPPGGGGGGAERIPTGVLRTGGTAANLTDTSRAPAVAVVDTGSGPHADLNVVGGVNCSSGNGFSDGNGHGTHVAGTIGARVDGTGVVGVAPGVPLYSVRVLNAQGSGTTSSIICGLDWVAANAGRLGIKTVNMSLGGSGTAGSGCASSAYRTAVCRLVDAGVTVVVAAGNSAINAASFVPAAFPEVITVSALADFNGLPGGGAPATCRTDVDDTFASFSNFGSGVDIIAPGVCIESTWKGGGYNTISGTSMASPHVAGAAARYLATSPTASPAQVQAALRTTTDWSSADDPDGIKEGLLSIG